MMYSKSVHLGASVIMAACQAGGLVRGEFIRPMTDSYTSSLSPNITVHGTTHLIVNTGSNATFTILEPSFTGEPDREVLATVAISAVTTAVPRPVQKHHGMHINREVTTVTEVEGYGTRPLSTSSLTSTKKTDAIGTTGTDTTHEITTSTPSFSATTEAANITSSSVSKPGVVTSTVPASPASSSSLSSITSTPTSSVSTLPGLTVPPTGSETASVVTPTSVHLSGSVHSVSGSQDLLVEIMGASLFSIALAFVVAA